MNKLTEFLNSSSAKILLSVFCLVYIAIESTGEGDFFIYYSAAAKVFGNESIYEMKFCDGFHYLYSLMFAICLYPFTFLPFYLAKFLWLCLNAVLLYRLFKIVFLFLDTDKQNISMWFYLLVFLFSIRFVHENFHASQITIIILYICLESMNFIFYKNRITGAIILAIGINIKLLPIVFIPYLLYRGQFKALVYVILACVLFWTLPIAFVGYKHNLAWMHDWWELINPTASKNILDVEERSFHGLTTLFTTLFIATPPDIHALSLKRNILDLSVDQLYNILNITRLLLVCLTVYFLNTRLFKDALSKKHQLYELSYIMALIPLIFPHQQHYAFMFLLPAIIVVLYFMFLDFSNQKVKQKITLIVLLAVIYLTFNLKILLGQFNDFYEHFKILTYGAILLLMLLFYKPIKVKFT